MENLLGIINLVVLTITLGVLCRYAFDTYKMQKAMSRQVELQIKPLIALEPITNRRSFELRVTNIGNGTALNIECEPMILGVSLEVLQFKIPLIRSLQPRESIEVQVIATNGEEEADRSWTAHLNPRYANRIIELKMKYNDIEFKELKQAFELGLGDTRIRMTRQY